MTNITSGSLGIGNVWSTVSRALAPAIRDLTDLNIELMGTETSLYRISRSETIDVYGQRDETYSTSIVSECIIKYPLNEIQLMDTVDNGVADTGSIDLMEILPITLYVKFKGTATVDEIGIEPGDILVDIIFDEWGNPIPIKLVVNPRAFGQFRDKYLIAKRFELSLVRGPIQDSVQALIDAYVATKRL